MENAEYTTFSTRQPTDVVKQLDGAAFQRFRKKNCRNQLITEILIQWLHDHAPPTPTKTKPSQFYSKTNSRRVKTKAETA